MVDASVIRYFDAPTQVALYDAEKETYYGGIAYGDTIICLCCGAAIDIEDYINDMENNYPEVRFPIIPLSWENLSYECLGDIILDPINGNS